MRFVHLLPHYLHVLLHHVSTSWIWLFLRFYCAFGNSDSSRFCNGFHVQLLHMCALWIGPNFLVSFGFTFLLMSCFLMCFFLWSILFFSPEISCSVGIHPCYHCDIDVLLIFWMQSSLVALGFNLVLSCSTCYCHVQAESMVSTISPTWTQLWRFDSLMSRFLSSGAIWHQQRLLNNEVAQYVPVISNFNISI